MTGPDPNDALRDLVRELLGELMPANGAGGGHHGSGGSGDEAGGHAAVVPEVPAPPVAAVLRPSTWSGPPAPGEVIGDGLAARADHEVPTGDLARGGGPAGVADVTHVRIDSDEDLGSFVRALADRLEDPGHRTAIRAGRVRFALTRPAPGSSHARAVAGQGAVAPVAGARTVMGAVTERVVRAVAVEGARLVLAPGAVLTPLARDCARSLGVQIAREREC